MTLTNNADIVSRKDLPFRNIGCCINGATEDQALLLSFCGAVAHLAQRLPGSLTLVDQRSQFSRFKAASWFSPFALIAKLPSAQPAASGLSETEFGGVGTR